jgi:HEAT repeat protein
VKQLADLLADLDSGDPKTAEAAALALSAHSEAALTVVALRLQGDDAEQRWWAARALAEFKEPLAGDLLSAALRDPASSVRQCAALSLSKRPDGTAIPTLIEMLSASEGLEARLAGDALVALGKPAVVALIAALEVEGINAKVEAARALALIGDTRAVSPLFKLLDSDSAVLEHWVSEGLDKMGVGMSFFKP